MYSRYFTNLTIKTKALNEPGRLYRKWLTEEKKRTFEYNQESKNIFELEELLKKVENEDILVYFKRWVKLTELLCRFYNSKRVNLKRDLMITKLQRGGRWIWA
jgi:hypothetical protein